MIKKIEQEKDIIIDQVHKLNRRVPKKSKMEKIKVDPRRADDNTLTA